MRGKVVAKEGGAVKRDIVGSFFSGKLFSVLGKAERLIADTQKVTQTVRSNVDSIAVLSKKIGDSPAEKARIKKEIRTMQSEAQRAVAIAADQLTTSNANTVAPALGAIGANIQAAALRLTEKGSLGQLRAAAGAGKPADAVT